MMLPPDLAEELQLIAAEATRGAPAGPALCRQLERDTTALLHRHYPGVRVRAEVQDGGIAVTIFLPQRGKPVQKVVFTLSTDFPGSSGGGRYRM